jgi:hypothetical protein
VLTSQVVGSLSVGEEFASLETAESAGVKTIYLRSPQDFRRAGRRTSLKFLASCAPMRYAPLALEVKT